MAIHRRFGPGRKTVPGIPGDRLSRLDCNYFAGGVDDLTAQCASCRDGQAGGIEPPSGRIKIRCLFLLDCLRELDLNQLIT
jgi:hypothetical protein